LQDKTAALIIRLTFVVLLISPYSFEVACQKLRHSACTGVDLLSCIARPPSQKKAEKVKFGERSFLWQFSVVRCKIAVSKISLCQSHIYRESY